DVTEEERTRWQEQNPERPLSSLMGSVQVNHSALEEPDVELAADDAPNDEVAEQVETVAQAGEAEA
ncbi:MAG: hypothetical protein WA009_05975, partial [Phototrophicaceae bacterium]